MRIQTNIVAKNGNPPISYNILQGESNEFPKNIILDANYVNDRTLDLQEQIDEISEKGGVVDIVATKSDLDEYDTSKLSNGDILKVLVDETHSNSTSYYKWDEELETFDYIGKEDAYYTKQEIDNMFGCYVNVDESEEELQINTESL